MTHHAEVTRIELQSIKLVLLEDVDRNDVVDRARIRLIWSLGNLDAAKLAPSGPPVGLQELVFSIAITIMTILAILLVTNTSIHKDQEAVISAV